MSEVNRDLTAAMSSVLHRRCRRETRTRLVVLETDQQYASNGLTPADPQTVPSIPEPTTFALLLTAAVVLHLMRRKHRKSARALA